MFPSLQRRIRSKETHRFLVKQTTLSSSQKGKKNPSKRLQQCSDTAAIERTEEEEEEALSAAATAGLGFCDQPSLLHPSTAQKNESYMKPDPRKKTADAAKETLVQCRQTGTESSRRSTLPRCDERETERD